MNAVYSSYLEVAKAIARDAGETMKEYFSIGVDTELKEDKSLITIADTKINLMVIERIKQVFPDHTILGEEQSHGDHTIAEYTWVVDPIDGTRTFTMGVPTNVFSLALTKNGKPVVAVVLDPYMDRLYEASDGGGAFLNGVPIHVSNISQLNTSANFGYHPEKRNSIKYKVLDELTKTGAVHDSFGSVAYVCLLVATGQEVFVVFDRDTAHDVAAVKLIVEEAGGVTSDIEGNPQRYDQPINGFVCGNGKLEKYVIDVIKRYKQK